MFELGTGHRIFTCRLQFPTEVKSVRLQYGVLVIGTMSAMSVTIESGEWLSCNEAALTMLGDERSAFGTGVIHMCLIHAPLLQAPYMHWMCTVQVVT